MARALRDQAVRTLRDQVVAKKCEILYLSMFLFFEVRVLETPGGDFGF